MLDFLSVFGGGFDLLAFLIFLPFLGLVTRTNGEVIKQVSILKGIKHIPIPKGRYEALGLRITSNNKTGESVDWTNLGQFRFLRNGDNQYFGFDTWERLKQIVNDEFTHYSFPYTSTDGGNSELETRLTNTLPGILPTNALHVIEDENAEIVADFDSTPGGSSGLNSIADAGSLEVRGYKNESLPEQAAVHWERTNVQFSGSGEKEIENVSGENVVLIYISDPDGVLDEVSLTRKMPGSFADQQKYDNIPAARLQTRYEEADRDFGGSSLHGIIVPENPEEIRNVGVDLELKVTGATSDLQVQYARLSPAVPSGSAAGLRQRQQLHSL
jgi:hypothetical protein